MNESGLFTNKIEEIRNTPVRIDPWRYSQVGKVNDGPYKGYYEMKVREETPTEPLVDVSWYGIVSADYYLDIFFKGNDDYKTGVNDRILFSRALLRESHTRRLSRVDSFLRENGLFLYIQSGWRHPKIQKLAKLSYAKKFGKEKANLLFASVSKDMAPPPHATGAAVDIEIYSLLDNKRLPMFVTLNHEDIFSLYWLEDIAAQTPEMLSEENVEVLKNRRILYHLLCTEGIVLDREELFTEHPGEFWHYGDGDPLSAYLNEEEHARYDAIYLNQQDMKRFSEKLLP